MATKTQTQKITFKNPYETLERLVNGLTEKEFKFEEILFSFYKNYKKNAEETKSDESFLSAFLAKIDKTKMRDAICQEILDLIVDRSNDTADSNIAEREEAIRIKMGIGAKKTEGTKIKRERVLAVLADFIEKSNSEIAIDLSNVESKETDENFENTKMETLLSEMKTEDNREIIMNNVEDEEFKGKTDRIDQFNKVRQYITELFSNANFKEAKKLLLYDFTIAELTQNINAIVAEINPTEQDLNVNTTPLPINNKYTKKSYQTKISINSNDIFGVYESPNGSPKIMHLCCSSQFLGGMDNGVLSNDTVLNLRTTISGTIDANSLFYPLRYGVLLYAPSVLLFADKNGKHLKIDDIVRLRVLLFTNIRQPVTNVKNQITTRFDSRLLEPTSTIESQNVINKMKTTFSQILEFALFFGCDDVVLDDLGCYDNMIPPRQTFAIFREVVQTFMGRFASITINCGRREIAKCAKEVFTQ